MDIDTNALDNAYRARRERFQPLKSLHRLGLTLYQRGLQYLPH